MLHDCVRMGRYAVRRPAPPASLAGEAQGSAELATSMVLKGAVGALVGAASAPAGREGLWGVGGFVLGVVLGNVGVVGIAAAGLWRKAG